MVFTWRMIRQLELHRNAGIERRFGAGVGACTGCRDRADAGHRIVVEAELVLPVAICNPGVNEVRELRAHERLTGVECQADRFAVELGLAGGAETSDTRKPWKAVRVALRPVPGSAAADGEILHV